MGNRYWAGDTLVTLSKRDVSAKCEWAHGDWSGPRLLLVNSAFELLTPEDKPSTSATMPTPRNA